MAILVDERSRVLVQGITGREGAFHTARMRAAGTNVVAGTSPGKGGQTVEGVPVFDGVRAAVAEMGANVAVLFVPARFARDAMIEAADAGIALVVCVTEGIPVRDMSEVTAHLARRGARLVGPNGPGLITPGRCSAGIMPAAVFRPGAAGVISRSGTLTYEVVHELTRAGVGQSTAVGMGGDAVHGLGFIECLELFEADPETEGVVAHRRDRRRRRGARGGVCARENDQAGGRLHGRLQRSSRQAHGPRRRHRGRHRPARPPTRRPPSRRPASRWRPLRPTSRACWKRPSRGGRST